MLLDQTLAETCPDKDSLDKNTPCNAGTHSHSHNCILCQCGDAAGKQLPLATCPSNHTSYYAFAHTHGVPSYSNTPHHPYVAVQFTPDTHKLGCQPKACQRDTLAHIGRMSTNQLVNDRPAVDKSCCPVTNTITSRTLVDELPQELNSPTPEV